MSSVASTVARKPKSQCFVWPLYFCCTNNINDSLSATIIQLTYSHTFLFIVRSRQGSGLNTSFHSSGWQDIHTRNLHEIFINKHTVGHFTASAKCTIYLSVTSHTHKHTPNNTNRLLGFDKIFISCRNFIHFTWFWYVLLDCNSVEAIWCMQFSHKNFNISPDYLIWCVRISRCPSSEMNTFFFLFLCLFRLKRNLKPSFLVDSFFFGSDCVCAIWWHYQSEGRPKHYSIKCI